MDDLLRQQGRIVRVVGDQQRGHLHPFQHLGQLVAQAHTQQCVQRRQRLIQQQQARRGCQRTGQRHALLLPARQVARQGVAQRLQVKLVE